MIVVRLPEFTTERYYILSELEQKVSSFVYLDEASAVDKSHHHHRHGSFNSYYLLWNLSNMTSVDHHHHHRNSLKSDIDSLFKHDDNDDYDDDHSDNNLLSIEVLLGHRNDWDSVKVLVNDTVQWIASTYHNTISYVVVGVADDAAATPALESILDYYNKIYSDDLLRNHSVRVIGLSRSSFLGHGIDQSPDAKSGVFQLLACCPCPPCHEQNRDEPNTQQQQQGGFEAWCNSVSLNVPKKSMPKKEAEVFTWLVVLVAVFIYCCYYYSKR